MKLDQNGIATAAIVGIIITVVVLAAAAVILLKEWETSPTALAEEEYLFAEIWHDTDGEVMEGDSSVVFMHIDFPFYSFDSATGVLRLGGSGYTGEHFLPASDNFLMAIGEGYRRSGDAGTGISCNVNWIYSIPSDNVAGLVVTSIVKDGTFSVKYCGTSITLAPGEKWENVATWTENVKSESGDSWCLVRYTTTVTISNYGLQDKDNILT